MGLTDKERCCTRTLIDLFDVVLDGARRSTAMQTYRDVPCSCICFQIAKRKWKTHSSSRYSQWPFPADFTRTRENLVGTSSFLIKRVRKESEPVQGHVRSIGESSFHSQIGILPTCHLGNCEFVLFKEAPSPQQIAIGQVADLLATVTIEMAHNTEKTSSSGGIDLQDSNTAELAVFRLFRTIEDFQIARLAVAIRIFEKLKDSDGSSRKLESFCQQWSSRVANLQELQSRVTPLEISSDQASLVLVGSLEHKQKKENLEKQWTMTALNAFIEFSIPQEPEETLIQETLFTSSLLQAPRVSMVGGK